MRLLLFFLITLYSFNGLAQIILDFSINDNFLIAHTLTRHPQDSVHIRQFQDEVFKDHKDAYKELNSYRKNRNLPPQILDEPLSEGVQNLFESAKTNSNYQTIYKETEVFLKEVKDEWEQNYESSHQYIKEITKISFDKKLSILITHPKFTGGRYLHNNRIHWGTKKDHPNYATIYLWHEILHSYMTFDKVAHSIIELASDYELNKALNGDESPALEGHSYLTKVRTWIHKNHWDQFLKESNEDLVSFSSRIFTSIKEESD